MKIIHFLLLLSLSFYSCNRTTEQEKQPAEHAHEHSDEEAETVELTPTQLQESGIELGGIVQRNLSTTLRVNGIIDIPPQNLVSVSAIMGGFIRNTTMLEGTKVKKGTLLALLENPEFIQVQQDYLETKSQLAYAEQEYIRQKELQKENVNAQKTYQQALAQFSSLKSRLAGLNQKLLSIGIKREELEKGEMTRLLPVKSPISGTITAVNVNIGKYVGPTDSMFEIVDTDHLHVELSVFEQDLPKVKIGQRVRFYLAGSPTKEREARVHLINPKINEDRTVRIHCHVENDDSGLIPQNYVKAEIETGNQSTNALPTEAVVNFESKNYIFLKKPKAGNDKSTSFEMVEVQTGVSENGFTEIQNLEADMLKQTNLVVKGAYTLLSLLKNSEEEGHSH